MKLKSLIAAFVCVLVPLSVVCGTPFRPGTPSLEPEETRPTMRLHETGRFRVAYGEATFGFVPEGDEHQAVGPEYYHVLPEGNLRVTDPVNRRSVYVDLDHQTVDVRKGIPAIPQTEPGHTKPDFPRVRKVSAEAFSLETGPLVAQQLRVTFSRPLASARVLGTDDSGNIYLLIELWRARGSRVINRQMTVISARGSLLASMKIEGVPLVPTQNEFAITSDGRVYRMITSADEVTFSRWEVAP